MKETSSQYNGAQTTEHQTRRQCAHGGREPCIIEKLFALRSGGRTCTRKLGGQAMMLIEELISDGGKSVHNLVRLEICQKSLR